MMYALQVSKSRSNMAGTMKENSAKPPESMSINQSVSRAARGRIGIYEPMARSVYVNPGYFSDASFTLSVTAIFIA